jgi:predicted HAD superfamily phosphohydrolase YqeG
MVLGAILLPELAQIWAKSFLLDLIGTLIKIYLRELLTELRQWLQRQNLLGYN